MYSKREKSAHFMRLKMAHNRRELSIAQALSEGRARRNETMGLRLAANLRILTPTPDFQKLPEGPKAPYDLSARCAKRLEPRASIRHQSP
jgi:hypothetical protein